MTFSFSLQLTPVVFLFPQLNGNCFCQLSLCSVLLHATSSQHIWSFFPSWNILLLGIPDALFVFLLPLSICLIRFYADSSSITLLSNVGITRVCYWNKRVSFFLYFYLFQCNLIPSSGFVDSFYVCNCQIHMFIPVPSPWT